MRNNVVSNNCLLELLHFSSGDSGVSYQIDERERRHYGHPEDEPVVSKPELRDLPSSEMGICYKVTYDYRLRIRHGAWGETSEFSTPLTLTMVEQLILQLQRVQERMERLQRNGGLSYINAPNSQQGQIIEKATFASSAFDHKPWFVDVKHGCHRDWVYNDRKERIAVKWRDSRTGEIWEVEPYTEETTQGSSGGNAPPYPSATAAVGASGEVKSTL